MNRKGFTLIELIIVVAIFGIFATIAIPKFADLLGKAECKENPNGESCRNYRERQARREGDQTHSSYLTREAQSMKTLIKIAERGSDELFYFYDEERTVRCYIYNGSGSKGGIDCLDAMR